MPANATRNRLSRQRVIAAKLLALLVSCALCFGALELFCRILGFSPPTAPIPPDRSHLHSVAFIREAQERGWIHWPKTHSITRTGEHSTGAIVFDRNGCGFREDQETPIKKPNGTVRIIVTGDSHTDGAVPNHESFANLLEQQLNHASAVKVDVINAGFATFSPYQELWAYQRVLQRFDPDYLVVAFYAGNDLWDLTATQRVHLQWKDGSYVHADPEVDALPSSEPTGGIRRLKNAVRERIAIYHALASIPLLRRSFGTLPKIDEHAELTEEAASFCSGGYWQSLGQAMFFRDNSEAWDECTEMMRVVLSGFQAATQANNVRMSLIIIPTLRQIHPNTDREAYEKAAAVLKLTEYDLQVDDRATDLVLQLANELNIPAFDLRTALRAASASDESQELYWRFDHHLSTSGHREVAKQLQQILSQDPAFREHLHLP